MGKLYVYALFHANLSFSSIPSDQYSKLLDKCYWPIVDLVNKGYKLGLEFSSSTLSTIKTLDSSFVDEVSRLWIEGKCDIIGSSLIQAIFPLIPEEVNRINLEEGRRDYIDLLGKTPELGFINEQTYARGIPELFADFGYKAVIMDWDNAAEFNDFPSELRYRPAFARGRKGHVMPVIWNSSLNSYKFQRCIYNRLSPEDFINSVLMHRNPDQDRAVILYGTDWEIFDYRPGSQEEVNGEVAKVEKLLKRLLSYQDIELKNPSEILTLLPPQEEVNIESAQCPVPCKNRDDYNVIRWAVCGRDNVNINTECYRIYNKLKNLEFFRGLSDNTITHWRTLTDLWGSDLRTKTTNEKHYSAKLKVGELSRLLDKKLGEVYAHFPPQHDFILVNQLSEDWCNEPVELDISFAPGEKRGGIAVELDGTYIPFQCEHKELYRDGSLRRIRIVVCPYIKAGYALEGRIVEKGSFPEEKFRKYNGDRLKLDTPSVKLTLTASTGGDIRELVYPKIDSQPLIGYLPPVYYDHIGHSSDYYTGGVQLCDFFGRMYNDTVPTALYLPENIDDYPIRVPVSCEVQLGLGRCWKEYYVYRNLPRVDLKYRFYFADLSPIFFRLGIVTLNPESFIKETLRFTTVNGSGHVEEFATAGKTIMHHASVRSVSSGRTCLGATEGWIDISDGYKGIAIASNKSNLYSVPMIEYEEIKKTYLMRVYHSISESDETGQAHWRGHSSISFSFVGHNGDLSGIRNQIRHINQPLIYIGKNAITDRPAEKELFDSLEKTNCVV